MAKYPRFAVAASTKCVIAIHQVKTIAISATCISRKNTENPHSPTYRKPRKVQAGGIFHRIGDILRVLALLC